MAQKKESLIVASKVKAYIKSKKMMTLSDVLGAISDEVYCMLDDAITEPRPIVVAQSRHRICIIHWK